MTKEEAQKYFDAVVGKSGFSVKEIQDDPRLCHILAHGCGRFPDDVENEDEFFETVLKVLSDSDEPRELTAKISISQEEWARLERDASAEDKSLSEYLDGYFRVGVLQALREGYIYNELQEQIDGASEDWNFEEILAEHMRTPYKSDNLKYRGFEGSVEYSEADHCFYGKTLGQDKICITYEGDDLASLKTDFKESVDEYLDGNAHIAKDK